MKDKTLEMTMLFDFFSELLTEKQREYFNLYYNENLSLSEIAEIVGISRQGVRDIIGRAESILSDVEKKTGIVSRFMEMNGHLRELESRANLLLQSSDAKIRETAQQMMDIMAQMKG